MQNAVHTNVRNVSCRIACFTHFGKFLSYIVIPYLVDFLYKLILLYFM